MSTLIKTIIAKISFGEINLKGFGRKQAKKLVKNKINVNNRKYWIENTKNFSIEEINE